MGGGVCMELAECIEELGSWSNPVFNGVSSVSDTRWQGRLAEDKGFGEEDN